MLPFLHKFSFHLFRSVFVVYTILGDVCIYVVGKDEYDELACEYANNSMCFWIMVNLSVAVINILLCLISSSGRTNFCYHIIGQGCMWKTSNRTAVPRPLWEDMPVFGRDHLEGRVAFRLSCFSLSLHKRKSK